MRYAILGGSFNPVHVGHLILAESALAAFGYDRAILVPAHASPFKPGAQGASPKDRLDMLAASIPAESRLTIEDCEIRREGVSYTIDTLKDIIARYRPEGKPGLILGDDLARDFHRWRGTAEIAELADIVVAHRIFAEAIDFPYPYKQLDNEILALSSGSIRERIAKGGAWRYLVPQGARFIIEDRRLYGLEGPGPETGNAEDDGNDIADAEDGKANLISLETIASIEAIVRGMTSPSRFLHSRNVAILAQDLCKHFGARFGLESGAGYLAGIAHDMCKSLPETELERLAKRDHRPISKLEKKKPSLLHARAAAVLLKERFGIQDRDVLEAIRLHTMADADMGPLAKALFIADKIEVSRGHVSPALRDIQRFPSLDALFVATLEENVAYLRSRDLAPSKGTLRLLEALKGSGA